MPHQTGYQGIIRCEHGVFFVPTKENCTVNSACSVCQGSIYKPGIITSEQFKKKQKTIEPVIDEGITESAADISEPEETDPEENPVSESEEAEDEFE